MIGGIIFLLIIYAFLIGAYWVYKREKTNISACDNKAVSAQLTKTIVKMIESGIAASASSSGPAASIQAIMDFEPKFDVGGIYSLEQVIKFHNERGDDYEPTNEENEQLLKTVADNCASFLKSNTKFKTNWLYFGDGF